MLETFEGELAGCVGGGRARGRTAIAAVVVRGALRVRGWLRVAGLGLEGPAGNGLVAGGF